MGIAPAATSEVAAAQPTLSVDIPNRKRDQVAEHSHEQYRPQPNLSSPFHGSKGATTQRAPVFPVRNPRPDEEPHLTRLALRRLTEDDVPHLGTATLQSITWSTVSGFKGLENDVILVAGLTDIESDWHRGVAYVGMSCARTRLHFIIHEDCDGKRRAREEEWRERVDSDVEMLV